MVADLFDGLAFTERKINLMYLAAKEEAERESEEDTRTLRHLEKLLEALNRRESVLLDTLLSEQIDRKLYDEKVADIKRERIELTRQIKQAGQSSKLSTLEPIKNIFLEANRAKSEFLEADDHKKRNIAAKLLWNLAIRDKEVAETKYKSPYQILARAPKNAPIPELLPD